MTAEARAGAGLRGALRAGGRAALLAGVALATLAAVILTGSPVLALAPVALLAAAALAARVPLRWSASVLLLLLLVPDDTSDANGQWHTPLSIVGDAMHGRLDAALGIPGLAASGMELAVLFLLWVHWSRRAAGDRIDTAGQVRPPRVVAELLVICVLAVLYADANGVLSGGEIAPWKLRNLLHPVLLYLLFDAAFRGPRDLRLLGGVVVLAAVYRSLLAVVVQLVATRETGGQLAHATNHGDSVLFAVAVFLLAADVMERPEPRRVVRAAALMPIVLVGCVENNRRIVWVMILVAFVFAYLLSPKRGWARTLTRAAAVALPVVLLYVAVGWDRGGKVFAPIRTLRSVVDTEMDSSAFWREVENYNLAYGMRDRPLRGAGLGQTYVEHFKNVDISGVYKEYRQWPHNTMLGLLLFLGVFAYTAVFALNALAVYLAVRAFRAASDRGQRAAALACIASVVACNVLAWGDTGAHYAQYKIFLALALTVAAKLAVASGGWAAPAPRLARGVA